MAAAAPARWAANPATTIAAPPAKVRLTSAVEPAPATVAAAAAAFARTWGPHGGVAAAAARLLAGRAVAELTVVLLLLAVCVPAASRAWQLYNEALLPHRTVATVPTPELVVRLDDRSAVETHQRVKELLGAANAYRDARRQDWAEGALAEALALDPASREALAIRASWDATPLPQPTLEDLAALERQARFSDLLGAAASLLEADENLVPAAMYQASAYLTEALLLAPDDATALRLLARVSSR